MEWEIANAVANTDRISSGELWRDVNRRGREPSLQKLPDDIAGQPQ